MKNILLATFILGVILFSCSYAVNDPNLKKGSNSKKSKKSKSLSYTANDLNNNKSIEKNINSIENNNFFQENCIISKNGKFKIICKSDNEYSSGTYNFGSLYLWIIPRLVSNDENLKLFVKKTINSINNKGYSENIIIGKQTTIRAKIIDRTHTISSSQTIQYLFTNFNDGVDMNIEILLGDNFEEPSDSISFSVKTEKVDNYFKSLITQKPVLLDMNSNGNNGITFKDFDVEFTCTVEKSGVDFLQIYFKFLKPDSFRADLIDAKNDIYPGSRNIYITYESSIPKVKAEAVFWTMTPKDPSHITSFSKDVIQANDLIILTIPKYDEDINNLTFKFTYGEYSNSFNFIY